MNQFNFPSFLPNQVHPVYLSQPQPQYLMPSFQVINKEPFRQMMPLYQPVQNGLYQVSYFQPIQQQQVLANKQQPCFIAFNPQNQKFLQTTQLLIEKQQLLHSSSASIGNQESQTVKLEEKLLYSKQGNICEEIQPGQLKEDNDLPQIRTTKEYINEPINGTSEQINQLACEKTDDKKAAYKQQEQESCQTSEKNSQDSCKSKPKNQSAKILRFQDSKQKDMQISNVVKNFLAGFIKFLEDESKQDVICEQLYISYDHIYKVAKKVRQMQKVRACNNLIIKDFFQESLIAPVFKYFLQRHADDWIKNSRIEDKEVYRDAVLRYLEVSQLPEQSEQLYMHRNCERYHKKK